MNRKPVLAIVVLAVLSCRNADTVAESAQGGGAAASAPAQADTGGLKTAAPADQIDPCAVVPKAELEPIFGEFKGAPEEKSGLRNERECHYSNMEGQWLTLSVFGGGDDRWSLEKAVTNMNPQTPIAGLGDDAFTAKRGTDSLVYIRRGDSIFEVSCSCGADKALAVARKAAARF